MIKVISRKKISDKRWNTCVAQAHNEAIYGYTWFLDHIAPSWMGIVFGDYDVVFPLIYKQKYGIRYLVQSSFFQRTAIYSKSKLDTETIQSFYKNIPKSIPLWDFCVDAFSIPLQHHFEIKEKQNLILNLNSSYETLYSAYNNNTKRNLKTALKNGLTIRTISDPEKIIDMYITNTGAKKGYALSEVDHKNILAFMNSTLKTKKSTLLAAFKHDRFLGAVLFAFSASKIYYLFSGVNESGKETKALFFIIDCFIKEHAHKELTLDFEGSMNEGVARFYKGFGSKKEPYYHIHKGVWNRIFTSAQTKKTN